MTKTRAAVKISSLRFLALSFYYSMQRYISPFYLCTVVSKEFQSINQTKTNISVKMNSVDLRKTHMPDMEFPTALSPHVCTGRDTRKQFKQRRNKYMTWPFISVSHEVCFSWCHVSVPRAHFHGDRESFKKIWCPGSSMVRLEMVPARVRVRLSTINVSQCNVLKRIDGLMCAVCACVCVVCERQFNLNWITSREGRRKSRGEWNRGGQKKTFNGVLQIEKNSLLDVGIQFPPIRWDWHWAG